jgi:(p)ppGpp synthase/HD superfamily hydrolase
MIDSRGNPLYNKIAGKMDRLEELLRQAGVSSAQATRFLQQVRAFRTQLSTTFAPSEGARILHALQLMVELHLDQAPRPDGTPYIEHPLAVASQVLEAMAHKDPDVVVAALLHDAVEDQAARLAQQVERKPAGEGEAALVALALEAIEERTQSARVRSLIAGLTNPDFDTLIAQRGIQQRAVDEGPAALIAARNALYAEHVREAIRDPDVALIKLFDLAVNALTLDAIPDATTRTRLLTKYTPVPGIMRDRLRDSANPLNIKPHKREELLARFTAVLQTFARIEAGPLASS